MGSNDEGSGPRDGLVDVARDLYRGRASRTRSRSVVQRERRYGDPPRESGAAFVLSYFCFFFFALRARGFFREFAEIADPISSTPAASALSLMCA